MAKKDFKEYHSHTSDSESTVDIELPEPIKGHRKVVTRVVYESETNNIAKARVGIKRGRTIFWFDEKVEPQTGVLYYTREPLVCLGREQVIVRFTGVHDADVLNVWEYGYHIEE